MEISVPGQKRLVVESSESRRIMPLALFKCLQGFADYLVLDADLQNPKI